MTRLRTSTAESAVVIGAGVAGLAAAIRLAAAGLSVTLLERHAHLGGKIRTTESEAGPVDAGPTVLTMRHVFDDLFETAGSRLEDHVTLVQQDILARHFWEDGTSLDLFADRDASTDSLKAWGGTRAAKEFEAFCDRAKILFEAFDAPMMQAGEPKLLTLAQHVLRNPSIIRQMAPLSTLSKLLMGQFRDPRLRQLFGRYATYVGGAPHLSPAVLALIWHAEASGVWAVQGGMHKLAEAMAHLARQLGVDVITGAHVDRIDIESGRVAGVTLTGGQVILADVVINAGDPRALATGEMGAAVAHVAPQTRKAERSFSARVHSFAATVSGPDLAHHNVFFAQDPNSEFRDLTAGRIPADPTLYLCAEDRGLGDSRPDLERFEIIANAPATQSQPDPEDLPSWHQEMMTRMARFGVTFSPTPTAASITTPQIFSRLFPASQGALYGQSPHGLMAAFNRPTARTPVPGLYLCGGGTHPGAGVPMATLSARHAVAAILSDRTSISTSAQTAMRGGMSTA